MTTKTILTTTALSLLLATSALAQTETAPPPTEEMATDGMMGAEASAPRILEEMTVGDLTGTDVMDSNAESIGSISDVVQGVSEAEAVIGIGGFLGIGSYDVALPISDLNYNADEEAVSVKLTREELEALPEYEDAGTEPLAAETPLSSLMVAQDGMDAPAATDAPVMDAPAVDAEPQDENSSN